MANDGVGTGTKIAAGALTTTTGIAGATYLGADAANNVNELSKASDAWDAQHAHDTHPAVNPNHLSSGTIGEIVGSAALVAASGIAALWTAGQAGKGFFGMFKNKPERPEFDPDKKAATAVSYANTLEGRAFNGELQQMLTEEAQGSAVSRVTKTPATTGRSR